MTAGNPLRERLARLYELADANNPRRILPMEGLRGLAVILVFFVHYHALLGAWAAGDSFTHGVSYFLASIGHSGVDLFFVLSGYLIYGAVISKRTRYLPFIRRRVERIYPTFLCVLAIYLVLSALFPSESKIPARPLDAGIYIVQNALLLPGIFDIQPLIVVAWSLSYEFFYYLFIPALVAATGMRGWKRFHRVVFFITLGLLYAPYCLVGPFSHIRLIMFVSGILLYEALHFYDLGRVVTPRADVWVLLGLAATFGVIYLLTDRQELLPHLLNPGRFGVFFRILFLAASFLVFTFACFGSRGLLRRVFSWAPLRWLGNMSYSYYLMHALTIKAVSFALTHLVPPAGHATAVFWIALPLTFGLTLATSTLLFLLVERRFSLSVARSKPAPLPVLHGVSASPEEQPFLPKNAP